jgi:hypothetical protein
LLLDLGHPDATTLVCGMGRSGTTWVAQLINHEHRYRVMFEPFFPARVPEASPFQYIQYLRPDANDPAQLEAARQILAGRIRNEHVDQDNRGFVFLRRIIKEIRCNLMLRWLAGVAPRMRIVLVVRHPLAVAASWLRLQWGTEAMGTRSDFDILTSQSTLLEDFPELRDLAAQVNARDPFERILFEWCAFHVVPLRQFTQGEPFMVHYERLLRSDGLELERLLAHVGGRVHPRKLQSAMARPSTTSSPRAGAGERAIDTRVSRDSFSQDQIDRAHRMIDSCGLRSLCDDS